MLSFTLNVVIICSTCFLWRPTRFLQRCLLWPTTYFLQRSLLWRPTSFLLKSLMRWPTRFLLRSFMRRRTCFLRRSLLWPPTCFYLRKKKSRMLIPLLQGGNDLITIATLLTIWWHGVQNIRTITHFTQWAPTKFGGWD